MEVKSGKANLFIDAQQATSTEAKTTTEALAPSVTVIAEKKAPVRTGTTIKAESQISASATQAQLSNRLNQKFKSDFAEKKANDKALKNVNAQLSGRIRDIFILPGRPGPGPVPGPTPGGGFGGGGGVAPSGSGSSTPPASGTTPPNSGNSTPSDSTDWTIESTRGWNARKRKHNVPG